MAYAEFVPAEKNGFIMFSEKDCHSDTVSCIVNTKRIDFKAVREKLMKKGMVIDIGYRKMNEKLIKHGRDTTFRIAHMGDLTLDEIKILTNELEKFF